MVSILGNYQCDYVCCAPECYLLSYSGNMLNTVLFYLHVDDKIGHFRVKNSLVPCILIHFSNSVSIICVAKGIIIFLHRSEIKIGQRQTIDVFNEFVEFSDKNTIHVLLKDYWNLTPPV